MMVGGATITWGTVLKGHSVRKVENAVEESWSLRAAGFLLLGQLSGFAKQCWYFLQAEKTTWLRPPLPSSCLQWRLPCGVLPFTSLPDHINRWSSLAKRVSVCTSYPSNEQELKVFQIDSKRLINSAGAAASDPHWMPTWLVGSWIDEGSLYLTVGSTVKPCLKSIPVWKTCRFGFTWFCHCKYLVSLCGLF